MGLILPLRELSIKTSLAHCVLDSILELLGHVFSTSQILKPFRDLKEGMCMGPLS